MQDDPFIGETFPTPKGGVITVTSCNQLKQHDRRYGFKCSLCSEDDELFSLGVGTTVKSVLTRGSIPCGCAKIPKWTEAQYRLMVSRAAEKSNSEVLWPSTYSGQKTKVRRLCRECGEITKTCAGSVFSGSTCKPCSAIRGGVNGRVPVREIMKRLAPALSDGYEFVGFVGAYTGAKGSVTMRCNTHGEWSALIWHVTRSGSRCPGCAKRGYDQTKKGYLYLSEWHGMGNHVFKIGITNEVEKFRRLSEQMSRNKGMTGHIVALWGWESGSTARNYENLIKKNIPRFACSRKIMPDGHTETISPVHAADVLDILSLEKEAQLFISHCLGSFNN